MLNFIGSLLLVIAVFWFGVPASHEFLTTVFIYAVVIPCIWVGDKLAEFHKWANTTVGAITIVGIILYYKLDSLKASKK